MIYLDYAATAPLSPSVRLHIDKWLDVFGNPSSLHRLGMEAETLLASARETIHRALDAPKGQIIFTGGGTEANNFAIFGSAAQLGQRGKHAITTAVEHPAVLEAFKAIEKQGWSVTYISPNARGDIAAADILQAIRSDTVLVSMMHVNNETGAVFPVAELGKALRAMPKIRYHVDGTQAFGKIPVDLGQLDIDLYTVSAHKLGGLKGTGGLFKRHGIEMSPHIVGGGQEFGLRSGTENVLGAIAFASAADEAVNHLASTSQENAYRLRQSFVDGLDEISGWRVVRPTVVSPYVVSAILPGLKGEVVVHALEQVGVIVSSGSACSSARGKQRVSHVLQAMGMTQKDAEGSVRFSWNPRITQSELDQTLQLVAQQTTWLRNMLRR